VPEPLADLSPVEAIRQDHECENFDCGKTVLNEWLQRYALQNDRSDGARTFVVHQGRAIKGYYSLAGGHVLKQEAPDRVGAGLANHPIPIILLARLAVDQSFQGRGLGRELLQDAMRRVLLVSENVAARALIVDAIDEAARSFYVNAGFREFPDQMRLFILLKDLRATLRECR
jgi:GNAT superfamily N-acetyltransferase